MTTLTFTGELTVTSCWCGIRLAIPSSLYREAHNNGVAVYCPLGHTFVWKETEADRLRAQIKQTEHSLRIARASATAARDQRDAAERSNAAYRGWITRLRNRISNGVCPVKGCQRHFDNVQAHIASKHPDWAAEHPDVMT
jgi:hypothetical protein